MWNPPPTIYIFLMVWIWLMIFIWPLFVPLPSKTMNIQCIIIFWYVKVDDMQACQSRFSVQKPSDNFMLGMAFWPRYLYEIGPELNRRLLCSFLFRLSLFFSEFSKFLISLDLRVKDEIRFSTPVFPVGKRQNWKLLRWIKFFFFLKVWQLESAF